MANPQNLIGELVQSTAAPGSDMAQRINNMLAKAAQALDFSQARLSGTCYDYKTGKQKTRQELNDQGKPTGKTEYVPASVLLFHGDLGGKTKMQLGMVPAGLITGLNFSIAFDDLNKQQQGVVIRNTRAHVERTAAKGQTKGKRVGRQLDMDKLAAGADDEE